MTAGYTQEIYLKCVRSLSLFPRGAQSRTRWAAADVPAPVATVPGIALLGVAHSVVLLAHAAVRTTGAEAM